MAEKEICVYQIIGSLLFAERGHFSRSRSNFMVDGKKIPACKVYITFQDAQQALIQKLRQDVKECEETLEGFRQNLVFAEQMTEQDVIG